MNNRKDSHREAASTAPLNTRVPGSPEWCYQTMSLLKFSYQHIHADQERFNHYLSELREHRAWEKVPVDQPYGTESKMLIGELGKRIEEIETELNATKQAQLAAKNRELDAATPNLKALGSNQHSDGFGEKINVTKPSDLNDAGYAVAKLRKDRPDIHDRVLAGEITPNAGMVEAGFRKKREGKKLSPFDKIVKLLHKLNDDELTRLHRHMVARKP